MKLIIKKGTINNILHIFIQDSSKSDGSGLTGLAYNSPGLTAYYIKTGEPATTAITLVSAMVGSYISGGFIEVDATNMPGIYELHPPDACLASGADQVVIFLKGAANMAPLPLEIQLRDNTEKDVKDVVDVILVDTNELQTNQNAWLTADVSNLDVAVSTRNATTPPTVTQIREEMDTNSTKMAPSQNLADYKADVSALALEASLATIKDNLDTHDQNIKAFIFSGY